MTQVIAPSDAIHPRKAGGPVAALMATLLCILGLFGLSASAEAKTNAHVFNIGSGDVAVIGTEAQEVIELTQVPCQFIESENGIDRGYTTTRKADCDAINARTGEERVASSEPLVLKPGKYIFRVINKNVPYELGFWLRGDGLVGRLRLPSVSGGGLMTGKSQDYEINLTPGEYLYSCPLNTTPDYKLVVKE